MGVVEVTADASSPAGLSCQLSAPARGTWSTVHCATEPCRCLSSFPWWTGPCFSARHATTRLSMTSPATSKVRPRLRLFLTKESFQPWAMTKAAIKRQREAVKLYPKSMTRPACVDLCLLYCRRPNVLMHGLQLFLVNPLSTVLRQLKSFFFWLSCGIMMKSLQSFFLFFRQREFTKPTFACKRKRGHRTEHRCVSDLTVKVEG